MRHCSLRRPGIYGPNRFGLVDAIKHKRYRIIGDGLRWTNRIHVADLSATICAVLDHPIESLPSTLCVTDDEPTSQLEVAKYVCGKLGIDLPDSISAELAAATLDPTQLGNQRVSNALLKRDILKTLAFPSFREGFGALSPLTS